MKTYYTVVVPKSFKFLALILTELFLFPSQALASTEAILPSPQGINAVCSPTGNQVKLFWDVVPGADGYKISFDRYYNLPWYSGPGIGFIPNKQEGDFISNISGGDIYWSKVDIIPGAFYAWRIRGVKNVSGKGMLGKYSGYPGFSCSPQDLSVTASLFSPIINSVTVAPCQPSSCNLTTTVIIDGQNFLPDMKVEAIGQDNGAHYNESSVGEKGLPLVVITGRNGDHQITVDFHLLECTQKYKVRVYSTGSSSAIQTDSFNLSANCPPCPPGARCG